MSIKFDLLPPSSTTFPLSSSCRHFQQQADICYPNLLFCPALYARGIKEKIPPPSKTNHRWEAQALHQVLVWGLLLLSKAGKEGCSRKALPWGSRKTGRARRGCTGAGHCMGNRFAEGRLFTEAIFHLGH